MSRGHRVIVVVVLATVLTVAIAVSYTLFSRSVVDPSDQPSENPKSLSVIAQETQEGTPEERAAAAKRVLPQVAATIKDASAPMTERMAALELARDANGPEMVSALKTATQDKNPLIRAAAVSTLATADAEGALPVLLQAAKDGDVNVRRAAVHALAKQDGREVLAALVDLLEDEDSLIRKVAVGALKQKTKQDFEYQYFASNEKRKASIEKWKAWLVENGGGR